MAAITGVRPELPPRLSRLMTNPERVTKLADDLAAIERHVSDVSRAAGAMA
jgi:hypothetical protein